MKYYVDTCIWLNLLNKEKTIRLNLPLWRHTELFLNQIGDKEHTIYISSIVVRELSFQNALNTALAIFINNKLIKFIEVNQSDKEFARQLENKYSGFIGFYDYLHIAVSKRLGATLITRDKKLIEIASEHIKVHLPEEVVY